MSEQNISSDAIIKLPVLLYGSVQVTKPETGDLYAEAIVDNPIPSAPTGLVASDAGLGDAVNLIWVSSASNFNVYKKVGAVYTKLNPNVLTEGTSYLAGNLTVDVPVDFVVRALNGLGQESGDSNVATATPTLAVTASRFTNPTYAVYINGTYWPTAILASVELGFGSDLSTASFTLPVDPRGVTPGLGEPVDVYINSRLLFRGYTTIKSDSIDSSGLHVSYTCHSNIIDMTKRTYYSTSVRSTETIFNVTDATPADRIIIRNKKNANEILTYLGVSNGPTDYPGHVDITDQTALLAAESVLSKIGNYRLYHDMATGATSVYRFGSNGSTVRQFQFSKNIVSYQIDESNIDVVKKVIVLGALTHYHQKVTIGELTEKKDPDGRLAMSFTISAPNIRDIQVFGMQNAKPTVFFDDEIQVTLADFETAQHNEAFGDSTGWTTAEGSPINKSNNAMLYPVMTGKRTVRVMRSAIGAKVVYQDSDHAEVFLSEIPKIWGTATRSGEVNRATVGQKSINSVGGDKLSVEILLYYFFYTGTVDVEFTSDGPRPTATAGSGEPMKSITDSQYDIMASSAGGTMSGSNNSFSVQNQMQFRAIAELARSGLAPLSGNITVIGDETINLRSSVSVKGQLLEVSHVSHSFQNGYTTTISLTNEPFVKNMVYPDVFNGENQQNSAEKTAKNSYYDTRSETYRKLKTELASAKDTVDKQAPGSGKYGLWQD